jgi:hypothetical protein
MYYESVKETNMNICDVSKSDHKDFYSFLQKLNLQTEMGME